MLWKTDFERGGHTASLREDYEETKMLGSKEMSCPKSIRS